MLENSDSKQILCSHYE